MSYFFIGLTLSLCSLFLINFKNNGSNNLVNLFNSIWLVILFMATTSIDGEMLTSISKDYVFITIILFIVSMNVGFLLFMPPDNDEKKLNYNNFYFKEDRLNVLMIVILILLIVSLRESVQYVLSGNLNAIRQSIYNEQVGTSGSLYSTGLETILVQWILNGLILALNIVTVTGYFKKNLKFRLVVFSLLLAIVFSVLTGGRIMLMKVGIVIFTSLFVVNKYKIVKLDLQNKLIYLRKKINPLISLIGLLLFFTIVISIGREGSSNDSSGVVSTFSTYITTPISYYAVLLDSQFVYIEYLNGGAFFAGITQIVDIILKNIVNYDYILPFQHLVNETSPFMLVSPRVVYNAFPTIIYYFYRDFGLAGIVVDSLLFTFMISWIFKRMKKSNYNLRFESYYLLAVYILVMSILQWAPAVNNFWITLLAINVLTSKIFIGKHNKN
ncbi:O-antigen polymerase [Aerococcus urinaeequi]|uniref:O-antigen polymerase n=1 Tax=Aerococcus urinaeequi TaxID=51665 RepID=UPI003B4892AB